MINEDIQAILDNNASQQQESTNDDSQNNNNNNNNNNETSQKSSKQQRLEARAAERRRRRLLAEAEDLRQSARESYPGDEFYQGTLLLCTSVFNFLLVYTYDM